MPFTIWQMKAKTHFFYQKFPIPGFRLTRIFTKTIKQRKKGDFRPVFLLQKKNSCLSSGGFVPIFICKAWEIFPKRCLSFPEFIGYFPKNILYFSGNRSPVLPNSPDFPPEWKFSRTQKYPIKPILSKQLSSKSAFSTQREAHRFNFSEISPEIIEFQKG